MVPENVRRPTLKVIITGASGFIGKNLVLKSPKTWEIFALYNQTSDFPQFIESHRLNHITPIKCDLTSTVEIEKMVKQASKHFDACIYLAANGDPALSVEKPLLDLKLTTDTVINFLSSVEVRRFIYFSSGAVYEGRSGFVSPEVGVNPVIAYAISHLASEQYIRFFMHRGNIGEYVILRFFGAYGPYEPERKIYTKLVRAFCLEGKNEFTVRGDGENLIDAMYIDDAIEGILKVMESGKNNLTADFCSGAPLTVNALVKTAGALFQKQEVRLQHEGSVPEYNCFHASPETMDELFGFRPRVSLQEGLTKFAALLKEQKGKEI